jgi:hypothetical protein
MIEPREAVGEPWVDKHIGFRIVRKGIESSQRLGRRRWVERTMSWLTGYRRLNHRYERHPPDYLAFLGRCHTLLLQTTGPLHHTGLVLSACCETGRGRESA